MTTSETPPPPPPDDPEDPTDRTPPLPPRPAPRALLRRDTDRHLAGVAGGLADHLGVDAAVIRIAFIVLVFFGGIGVPLYLAGWLAMPSASMPQTYVQRWFGESPSPGALVLLALGFLLLVAVTGHGDGPGAVGWGLALLFGGWLLFRADSRTATAGAPPPGAATADSLQAPGTWHGAGGTTTVAPAAAVRAPRQPRPRSILGRLTVGTALAAVGVAALLDQLGVLALRPVQYVALALTITGLGLVAGAWVGRAYGLIALGVLLVPVLLVLSAAESLPVRSGMGETSYAPGSVTELRDEYALGVGRLELDLRGVDFGGTVTDVRVSVGLGETVVIVPDDVTVAVQAEMRAGEVDLFGTRVEGAPFRDPLTRTDEGRAGGGRLQLQVDNGLGELTIRRASEEL